VECVTDIDEQEKKKQLIVDRRVYRKRAPRGKLHSISGITLIPIKYHTRTFQKESHHKIKRQISQITECCAIVCLEL
jgi:hypothetical protein